jgi:hypothetical protein
VLRGKLKQGILSRSRKSSRISFKRGRMVSARLRAMQISGELQEMKMRASRNQSEEV